jgi:C-terminal processing protease CtpA/Prc
LSDLEVKRATVQGLLARLAPGVALAEAAPAGTSGLEPFRSEVLDNRIGYARLGSTTPENITALDAALAGFVEKKLPALVLDLRATPAGSEFEQAVEVCRRFVPKGKVLFTVKRPNVKHEEVLTSKDDPVVRGIVVVLVDRDTAGAAEVIAVVLRTHVHAMVIGQQTRGEAVEFKNFPLPSGKVLRVAVAEVTLPESAPVFPGGVKPDVPVDVPQETTDAVLKQGLESGAAGLVFETERARMNEAALVAGMNPELDAAQTAQQQAKGEKPKLPLRDAVLQRAVDFVTTVAIYEKQKAKK